jgi:hypothetical protein
VSFKWILSGFPIKILHAFFFSPIRVRCFPPLTLHYLITIRTFGREWRSCSIPPHIFSSLLGPNDFLSTLFSNMSSLCYFLDVSSVAATGQWGWGTVMRPLSAVESKGR